MTFNLQGWDADMDACPVQSLVAARNMVVQRLRAITDERRRLMAALHSFVLQVCAPKQIPKPEIMLVADSHAFNDNLRLMSCPQLVDMLTVDDTMRCRCVVWRCACMLLEFAGWQRTP